MTYVVKVLLESHLATWAEKKGIAVAYPNVPFSAPEGIYLQSHVMPALTESADVEGEIKIHRGVYQINVVSPAGRGTSEASRLCAEIVSLFKFNTTLNDGVATCHIISVPGEMPGIQTSTTYTTPIRMSYWCSVSSLTT